MIPFLYARSGTSPLFGVILAIAGFLALRAPIAAQTCVMACPPMDPPVPVSLSSACEDILTAELLGVVTNGCPGDLEVVILVDGQPAGNVITAAMIGQTFMVTISHPPSGQSCMTQFTVLDKQDPVADCPDNVVLPCNADLDAYAGMTEADVQDCSPVTIYRDDVPVYVGECNADYISHYTRTYVIVDAYDNADTCVQQIYLQKASLDNVQFPADLKGPAALACAPPPSTMPEQTGYPTVGGHPVVNGSFCNLAATYTDFIFTVCSGSYKIQRAWVVMDWCVPGSMRVDTQLIEVLDKTPPVVTAPADVTISTDPSTCTGSIILPPATVAEDCATSWNVRINGPFGTINSNGGPVSGLPVGTHMIQYIARTDCQLEGMDIMLVTVTDQVPPTTVCHATAAIPVNNEGITVIPAGVFNSASYDNCGDVYFKVKRMSPPAGYSCANPGNPLNQFDDFIQFCCADIANNNIMVILRVYDVPPGAGPVTDDHLAGHYNECMVQVEVQDKMPPQITCPSDLTISCQFPFTEDNLDVFGTVALSEAEREQICFSDPGAPEPGVQCHGLDGLATDNCGVTVTHSASVSVGQCGTGSIVRTFTATDAGGLQATCQQTITIVNYDPFGPADIAWPQDYTTSDICDISALDPEDLPAPYNFPVLQDGPCDMVAATHEDLVFDLTNDDQACFKIVRTWTVMDWCQLNTPAGGIWTHMQVIKVMNTVAPSIAPLSDITECSYAEDCGGLTMAFQASATDDCSGPATLTWRYFVDEDNNNVVDFISPTQGGAGVTFERYMPVGTHRIIFTVWDQCGNTTTEEQLVTVEHCKGPSAKCIHGLSTNLMAMDMDGNGEPDWGMVSVQASMFDAGSDQVCGNPVTLAFSADPLNTTRVFDCSAFGINEVEVWVIDQVTGLTDFCLTTLDVQDNDDICPQGVGGGNGTISGNISVPGAGKLGGAKVHLEGSGLGNVTTTPEGYFAFPSMTFGGNYVVRPERNHDHRNGVTTLDLVRIQKHLLGLETFSQPYQYIAADANNSGSVTAIDILQIRKLILGLADAFPNNTSWRFIDRGHVFPDPHNPWASAWPETYTISPFSASMNEVDFDAVKVGDLNGSASLRASGAAVMPRSGGRASIRFTVTPEAEAGIYAIQVSLADADRYQALQFSFNWDQSSHALVNWAPGPSLQADELRMPQQPGESGALAAFHVGGWAEEDLHLFTMWVRSSPGSMPFNLFLGMAPAQPLAYAAEDEAVHTVFIESPEKVQPQALNRPNPFRDMTIISFDSRVAAQAMMKVVDANGRTVMTRQVDLIKGQNEIVVRRAELGAPGIYRYDIEAADQFISNRMIIVE